MTMGKTCSIVLASSLAFYIVLGFSSVQAQVGRITRCREVKERIGDKRQEFRACQFTDNPYWQIVGKLRTYNSSGQLISEENYAPMKWRGATRTFFDGLQTFWDGSGRQISQSSFKTGTPEWLKRWYPNGQLIYHAQFNDGRFQNPFIIFDQKGGVELEVMFSSGKFCEGSFTARSSNTGEVKGKIENGKVVGVPRNQLRQISSLDVYCLLENMKFQTVQWQKNR
jgi:hypothetical protein